jgi:hypothetical protein
MRGLQIRRRVGDSELALTALGIDTTCYPCLHISGRRRGAFDGWRICPGLHDCTMSKYVLGHVGWYLWAQPRASSDRHQTPGVQRADRPKLGRPTLSMPMFCHATLSAWLGQSDGAAAGERGQRGGGARAGETWRIVPDPRVLGQSAVSTSTCSQAALVRERIRIPARMLDDGQFRAGYGCAV